MTKYEMIRFMVKYSLSAARSNAYNVKTKMFVVIQYQLCIWLLNVTKLVGEINKYFTSSAVLKERILVSGPNNNCLTAKQLSDCKTTV